MEPALATYFRPIRILRPVRAFPCPKELTLVPGTECRDCSYKAQAERPTKHFWIHCEFPGGGEEFATMRAKVRERNG